MPVTYLASNGSEPFHDMSHGESFRSLPDSHTCTSSGQIRPGFYILEEPGSALPFTSSLYALAMFADLLKHTEVQVTSDISSPIRSASCVI